MRQQATEELEWWRSRCAQLSVENEHWKDRAMMLEDQLNAVTDLSLLAIEVAMELLMHTAHTPPPLHFE